MRGIPVYNGYMQTTSTSLTATVQGHEVTVNISDTTFANGQRSLTVWKDQGHRGKFSGIHMFHLEDGTVRPQRLLDAPKFAAQAVRDYLATR